MGCLVRLVLGAALLAMALVGVGIWAWRVFLRDDVVTAVEDIEFEVRPGETVRSVLDRLAAQGVDTSGPAWELALRWLRPGACLQAGWHRLAPGASAADVLEALCARAYARTVRLLVPEGTNIYQLSDRVAELGLADRAGFLERIDGPDDAERFGIRAPSLEGYLFPDTYALTEGATPDEIVTALVTRGSHVRGEVLADGGPPAGSTIHELLTVASIVEEEAAVPEERARIAAVIRNRLRAGMKLQCDPTCVYGPSIYQRIPTRALCRDPESRYSTYVISALPPTPITNPGRASIEAALAPAPDDSVLYFVAMQDGTGRHAFARTLSEHEANVDLYLR